MAETEATLREQRRLAALKEYDSQKNRTDIAFEELAQLASKLFNVPIALVTLIDDKFQWYMGNVGSPLSRIPREDTFCKYAILGTELMVVPDASVDVRFSKHPHVTAPGGVRFYAGAPILTSDGQAIGSVCIVDTQPRNLLPTQGEALMAIARTSMRLLEQASTAAKLAKALSEVAKIKGLVPICCSCKNIHCDEGYWSRVEEYFNEHTGVEFSHSVCPECMKKLYPGYVDEKGNVLDK